MDITILHVILIKQLTGVLVIYVYLGTASMILLFNPFAGPIVSLQISFKFYLLW